MMRELEKMRAGMALAAEVLDSLLPGDDRVRMIRQLFEKEPESLPAVCPGCGLLRREMLWHPADSRDHCSRCGVWMLKAKMRDAGCGMRDEAADAESLNESLKSKSNTDPEIL